MSGAAVEPTVCNRKVPGSSPSLCIIMQGTSSPVVCPSSQQSDLPHLLQLSLLELLSSSSTKREAMSISYPKREVDVNGQKLGMVFKAKKGSANLVALYNMCTFTLSSLFGVNRDLTEKEIKDIIGDLIKERCRQRLHGVPADHLKDVLNILDNFRASFSLEPCMCTHMDFKNGESFKLCSMLEFKVFHVWVLNPEVRDYENLKDFTRADLVEYINKLGDTDKQQKLCRRLLDDANNQMTSYGFRTLPAELQDDSIDLLFCRNRLDIIHKHNGVVLILVTEDAIRKKMPDAYWMLFEEQEESIVYFTEEYVPVRGQPYEEKAVEFYRKFDENSKKGAARSPRRKDKRKVKNMDPQGGQSDASAEAAASEASGDGSHSRGQADNGRSHQEEKPVENPVGSSSQEERKAETVISDAGLQSSKTAASEASGDGSLLRGQDDSGSSHREKKTADNPIGSSSQEERKAETVISDVGLQNTETAASEASGDGSHLRGEDDSGSSQLEERTVENPIGCSSQDGHSEGVKTSMLQELDDDPKAVASLFLSFLINFKDDGCSEPYFKGNVAAFTSQAPYFYVPYPFIVAHDEVLALTIQDNYSRICEDLRKSVVRYLSENEVSFPNVILKIIGLPGPKSVQYFLDFLTTINLHEHYDNVYGGDSEALPSYDSRRMALGYIDAIVAKFRTGRSWAGKWSELQMKVRNGSKFLIECEDDCDLTLDNAFLDLSKFGTVVLDRLKFNGRLPPYLDEFGSDTMLINDCFGDSVKWERFLQLISYPMGLKPPLVRAAFLCNIYVAANANSSGDPPRYKPFHSKKDCADWKKRARKDELLRKVFDYPKTVKSKKYKLVFDSWSNSHWHLFMFTRLFLQHALEHSKGKDKIQEIEDISVVEILLSRTLCKAIAKSIRFLVLNCGVDTIFSSLWRHYAGSDYDDKQVRDLACTTTEDVLQELVDNISADKKLVCTEVSIYSEKQHISIIKSEADLATIKLYLNENGFEFQDAANGQLQCESISLYPRHYPATKLNPDHTSIMVEGPYSDDYTSVFLLLTECLCS